MRIEDTDQSRFVPGAEVHHGLPRWCGLDPDESRGWWSSVLTGKVNGSPRKEYALQLVKSGHAYYAFDTTEDLEQMRAK